jgi:hypothetical protein
MLKELDSVSLLRRERSMVAQDFIPVNSATIAVGVIIIREVRP